MTTKEKALEMAKELADFINASDLMDHEVSEIKHVFEDQPGKLRCPECWGKVNGRCWNCFESYPE